MKSDAVRSNLPQRPLGRAGLQGLTFAILGLAAASAMATEYGRVIRSSPITAAVSVPQQVCSTQQEVVRQPGSGLGAVLGAVAGGVVGHSVGKGAGNALATGVGVMAGAVMGDKYEQATSPSDVRPVQRCSTGYVSQNQVVGYQVEYEYAGQRYTTQTKYKPGKTIALNVQVNPSDEDDAQPVAQQQVPVQIPPDAPATVYQQPQVVYAQPQVVYAAPPVVYGAYPAPYPYYYGRPPVSLSFGWSNYRGYEGHHHGY
jgi:uncharacterized protein YcfJ